MIYDFKGHKFILTQPQSGYIGWEHYECIICKQILIIYNHYNIYVFTNGILGKTNTSNPKDITYIDTELSCDEVIIKNIVE